MDIVKRLRVHESLLKAAADEIESLREEKAKWVTKCAEAHRQLRAALKSTPVVELLREYKDISDRNEVHEMLCPCLVCRSDRALAAIAAPQTAELTVIQSSTEWRYRNIADSTEE